MWALALIMFLAGCKEKAEHRSSSGPTEEQLQALKAESGRIMPKTYAGVWVGMTEEELKKERPDAQYQPQRTDPLEHRWYSETSPTGVKVWFGVERDTGRLGVVQFAHMFDSWATFSSHATALIDRFGTSNELYSCPSTPGQAHVSMTRLLWPRQPIAVMEAVLEVGDSVSVTMVVAPVEECRMGIEKQKCVRMDKDKALEQWVEEQVDRKLEEREKSLKHGHGVTPPNTVPIGEGSASRGQDGKVPLPAKDAPATSGEKQPGSAPAKK